MGWQDFLARSGPAYRTLDDDLGHLTSSPTCLLEGADGR